MIKNIIFDWSGVIKDCVESYVVIINLMFKQFGGPQLSLEEFKANWTQPYMLFYNKYLPDLNLEEEQAAYKKATMEAPRAKPYPGIVDLIKELKQAGINMVVLSSDFPETLLPEITHFGLDGIFLDIVTSVHDKSEGMHHLMNKYNFKAEETIFVGDSNHEVEAGEKAGLATVAVTWGFSNKERLKSFNPTYLVDTVAELKSAILKD